MSRIPKEIAKLMNNSDERAGISRRPLFRIYEIHSAVLRGHYPNCTKLAEQIGVQPKTIQRDISFMRDELKLPLVYDEILHGYFYDQDVSEFPVFQTSVEELAGLFLARNALESVRGTPLSGVLSGAFAKLTRGIMEKVEFSWEDLDQSFTRKVVQQNPRDVQRFGELAKAIVEQLVTTFHYRKLGADQAELRKVQPLHMGEVEGGWYLIGHDLERDALRTFALPRMTRIKVSKTRFDRPEGFSGSKHLKQSFGIWHVAGDFNRHLVRVELRNYAARLAQERQWHPTQEVHALNSRGTRVEIRFEVGRLEEVLRWVLSFGRQARVLGPPELIKMLRDEIRAMDQE